MVEGRWPKLGLSFPSNIRHHTAYILMPCSTVIIGTGSYAPARVLTNDDLAKMVDTSDEWIRTRSGIRERRIAAPDEHASDMGVAAGKRALEDAKLNASEIDLLIVATVTPDMPMPAVACLIQH